jgi:hypothetical protein
VIDADLSPSAFLTYCQANEVSPYALHVRSLGEDGRQTGGGPVGETLCGRWISDGWDTELPVTLETLGQPMLADTTACPRCWVAAHADLDAGSDPATTPTAPAAVLAVLAARLAQVDLLTSDPASAGRTSLPHGAKVPVGPIRAAIHAGWRLGMVDTVQAALAEIAEDRRRHRQAVRDRTQERYETAVLVTAIRRAAGWPDPDDGYEDGPPTGHLALAVLTTERDQLIEQVRAAGIGPAADLVAELVRRADAADQRAAAAERAAAEADDYARLEAVAAERFRAILPGLRRIAEAGELSGQDVAWLINVVTAPDGVRKPPPDVSDLP